VAESIHRLMPPRDWALLVLLSILWGGSFFFIGVAVKALPPLTIVALRLALAALLLLGVLRAMGLAMPRDRASLTAFCGMGLLNNVIPFCLLVWGQTRIASGLAAILNATTPVWTVIFAHLLTPDEKMTGHGLAGVGLGFGGVIVLVGPDAVLGMQADLWAQIACLAATVCYAFAGIYGRRFKQMGLAPMTTAVGQLVASSALLLPVAIIFDRPWNLAAPGLPTWSAIVGLAVLSTALGYVIYFRLLASAGAINLTLVTLLVPVSAVMLGRTVLGEKLATRSFVGMGLVGLGLLAIDGRAFTWWREQLRRAVAQSRRSP
jgi:drug/metabolite transporter (DMT)-like permease